ncbi:transmembrane protein, partial [Cystoisospora suis]
PEHFDSYNPSSLRQVTFCGWVRHQKRLFSSSSSSSKGVLSSYCGDTLLKTATVRLLDSVCSFTSGRKRLEENGEEEEEDYFAYLRRAKRIALSSSSPSWRGRGEGRGDLSTKTKKNRFTSIEGHHDWNSYYSFRHSLHDGNSRDSAEELLLSPHSHLYDTIGESLPSSLPRRLSKADEGNSHRKEKKEYEEDTSSSSPSSQRALKEALAALHAALEGDEHLSSSSPADSSTVSSSPFSSPHSGSHSSPSKKDRKEKKKERYTHSSSTSSQATQSSSRGWSFRSFLSAFISSVSLTIATEFGDRTFFIAALLSLKYRKILVFVATCSSLFLMTAFSTLVGHLFHYVAAYLPLCIDRDLPIDAWLSTVMLFLFAFIHLRSYELPHHGGQEKEEEKEKEGDRRGGGEEEKKKRQQKEEEEKKIGASMKEEGEKEEEEDERREKGRERGEKRATKTKMGEKMRGENAGMRKKDVKKKRSTSSSFLLSESETEIEEFLSDTEEIRRKKSQVSLREERRKEEKKRSDTCRSSMPTSCPYFHSSPSSFSPQDVIEREFRENSSPFSDTTSNDSMEGENSRNLPLLLSSS